MNRFPICYAAYNKPFIELALDKDSKMSQILKQLHLKEEALLRSNFYLPTHVFGIISHAAARITEEKSISLMASQVADSPVLHPELYRRVHDSKNLAQALNAIFAYQHKHNSDAKIWIDYVEGELRICLNGSLKPSNRGHDYAIEYGLFLLLRIVRKFYGSEWKPKYIAFQHKSKFIPKIAQQTENNQIIYGASCSYIPIQLSPEEIKPFELKPADSSKESLSQVCHVIDAFWNTDFFSLDYVAHLFGVSERTLQRLFVQHNTTFRDYLNKKKIEKSVELLKAGVSVTQIADMLNYSDPPTFARAVRKQLGMSPTKYISSLNIGNF